MVISFLFQPQLRLKPGQNLTGFAVNLSFMERLLNIVDLLRGKQQLTSAELALQLGISERTLRRDF